MSDSDEELLDCIQNINEILDNSGMEGSEAYLWQHDLDTEVGRVEINGKTKKEIKSVVDTINNRGYVLHEIEAHSPKKGENYVTFEVAKIK